MDLTYLTPREIQQRLYQEVTSKYKQRIENDESGFAIYVGEAEPGVAEGTAGWRIKKLTYTNGFVTAINWAEGTNAFDKTWSSRATYNYS